MKNEPRDNYDPVLIFIFVMLCGVALTSFIEGIAAIAELYHNNSPPR